MIYCEIFSTNDLYSRVNIFIEWSIWWCEIIKYFNISVSKYTKIIENSTSEDHVEEDVKEEIYEITETVSQ